MKYVGIVCFVVLLSFFTGMYKQPFWFRLIYTFPIILLLLEIETTEE